MEALRTKRREVLQVGCSGLLGMSLPGILAGRAGAAPPDQSARSVVVIYLPGGPSHLDTFDPKPDAPAEVRGTFRAIATTVAGIRLSEHLPRLAQRMRHLAIVRSMAHSLPHHDAACFIPCGIDEVPVGFRGTASRADWPVYAAALDALRPTRDACPTGVMLPFILKNGPNQLAGTHAGFLGPKHDPLQLDRDPSERDFRFDGLRLPADILGHRFEARRRLLEFVDRSVGVRSTAPEDALATYRERAAGLLTSSRLVEALRIQAEPDSMRDRYGRTTHGQSLLLARRLVEAGVPVVQANLGAATEWDTHYANEKPLREKLLPRLDQGVAALLDDLSERGLLPETLVVVAGEFGRTPKIGDFQDGKFWPDGRGHWAACFSAVFAGGGVLGGQVVGGSDRIGAYPASRSYRPSDLGATIYAALGINPASTVHDMSGRPHVLNLGAPIAALYGGAA